MKCLIQYICVCLWFGYSSSFPRIDEIRTNEIDEMEINSKYNDIFESEISDLMQSYFLPLSNRVKSLQDRLKSVEMHTQEISDRLNHVDCYDIKVNNPLAESGLYKFHLDYKGKRPVHVYCDMITTGGGWTVLQQRLPRDDNSTIHPTDFNRVFHEYKVGFGEPDRDYWIGLENIFLWTNTRQYELRIELSDFMKRNAYALYNFYIDGEDKGYRLHVSDYRGDAGDALADTEGADNFTANEMMFSTHDLDRDTSNEINCAKYWNINGWWYNRCSWANLNGPYKMEKEKDDCIGINWHKWHNKECLRSVRMMIRPRKT